MFAGHMHCHDEFSPLDGLGNRNQLSRQAVKNGQTHLGCTNHGRLGSALDHVHACRHPEEFDDPDDPSRKRSKDERIIPILGIEAFWRPDRHMDLTDKNLYGKNGHNWAQHLTIHAGSLRGWRTLMRLSSKSWVPRAEGGGFYGRACFDWDMLEHDHEDIIVSTACLSSPLSQLILKGYDDEAEEWCRDMIEIVGPNRLFFEIMPHNLEMQRTVNIAKVNIANRLGLPFMVTGDVHAPYEEWADTQSIVRMAAYGTSISKQEKKKDAGEDIYTEQIDTIFLSSEEQLKEQFKKYHPDLPASIVQQGLDNTVEFTRGCKGYVIGKTPKMPRVSKTRREGRQKLYAWCLEGLERIGKADDEKYIDRFEYEFDVLDKKNVIDYFLIVGDFVRWAKSTDPLPGDDRKKRPIRVGLGRGSAAGSLVSYLVGITGIDPVGGWDLLFERFLNPDRAGIPDIDVDFETEVEVMVVDGVSMDGREMVIEYLKRKYGRDHVSAIIAYQTFAPRTVIKSVADTLDLDFRETKKVTDSIGDTDRDLVKMIRENEGLAKWAEKYEEAWKHILRLEFEILRDSRHAGGIVITDKPTTFYMPTQIGKDEKSVVTAWADRAGFPIVSDYGFLKNDILGVTSLAKQELACQMIRDHYDEDFEPNDLPCLIDPYAVDEKVIDAFTAGMTVGVFQFSGRGITQLLRHIKPDSVMDIAVANALYRPGPMKESFKYGDRKNGKVPDSEWYWHDAVEPLLKQTCGVIAFQEQVMSIVKVLGNFTGGESDLMRKAISKLYRLPGDAARNFMQAYYDKWQDGCESNGLSHEDADVIWEAILEFAGYGFCKAHAGAYALQAYQDQHIKIHYPLAFYAADLTITKKAKKEEQIDYLKRVMREAAIFDIQIDPPDINRSERGWSIDGDRIRYGLMSIAGLGGAAAQDVIKSRPFESFTGFMKGMPSTFGTDTTVALAKAGAFDDLIDRSYLLGKTRKWPETTRRFKVLMTCGCKKGKTVKWVESTQKRVHEEFEMNGEETLEDFLDMATQMTMDEMECKKHPDAEVEGFDELDPMYYVAAWHKDHSNSDEPDEYTEPSQEDVMDAEIEALNIPLSMATMLNKYHEFVDERIFTEEEFAELPAKPSRSGKKHGSFCSCDDCEAAHCVIGGEIVSTKVIETKKSKEKMAFVDVAFGTNQWSVTLFPYIYKQCGHMLDKPTAFLLAGHKDNRNQMLAYDIKDVVAVAEAEGWKPPIAKSKKTKININRKKVALARRSQ